jgi:hypothetical protein
MKSNFVASRIKLAHNLDKIGLYKASDNIFSELLRMAQITPSFSVTKHDYVGKVPYGDLEDEFEDADNARLDKQDRFRSPDYYDDGESDEPDEQNTEAKLHGPSGTGIAYVDPGPTTKSVGMDESANDGSLDNFTFENTYEQNVADGKGYLNRIPR